jgi:flavoprotein
MADAAPPRLPPSPTMSDLVDWFNANTNEALVQAAITASDAMATTVVASPTRVRKRCRACRKSIPLALRTVALSVCVGCGRTFCHDHYNHTDHACNGTMKTSPVRLPDAVRADRVRDRLH